MFKAIAAAALGFILVLWGCSRDKLLTTDELRSELISAKSVAAETDMFLDYVRQSRATKYYAEGHLEYLTEEIERSGKEFKESSPAQGQEDAVQNFRAQFDALETELHRIRGRLDDETALAIAKQHIGTVSLTTMKKEESRYSSGNEGMGASLVDGGTQVAGTN